MVRILTLKFISRIDSRFDCMELTSAIEDTILRLVMQKSTASTKSGKNFFSSSSSFLFVYNLFFQVFSTILSCAIRPC
jgi:hypothetical protein